MSDRDEEHVLTDLELVSVSLVEEPVNPACVIGGVVTEEE